MQLEQTIHSDVSYLVMTHIGFWKLPRRIKAIGQSAYIPASYNSLQPVRNLWVITSYSSRQWGDGYFATTIKKQRPREAWAAVPVHHVKQQPLPT